MNKTAEKKLSLKYLLQIFGIWTLAAISMSTQMYLNSVLSKPAITWFIIFLKQLPAWILCALLTPVIFSIYDRYPLDTAGWKKNLVKQLLNALLILTVFSHFRLWAMNFIINRDTWQLSINEYINSYLSQVAWDFTIYVFIVVIIFASRTNARRRQNELYVARAALRNKELENQLKAAQLEALKLQLSPHFLFNTLNTINALIRSGEYVTAIHVNTKLGDFMRTTLYTDHSPFVSFEKEMQFLDLYFAIELLRFKDRLTIEKEVAKECLNILVPYFILQPVIENAIKHGIAKQGSANLVSVRAELVNNFLQIIIYNDGKLLPENWIAAENPGIGLRNVISRLQKIYGKNYSFSINNQTNKKGVQVMLSIPAN